MHVRRSPARGFTLLEVAIALAILSVALLLGMSLLLGQARMVRRIDADHAARAALEATLEAIRAGVLPLRSASYGGEDLAGIGGVGGGPPPAGMTIDLDVTASSPPGLYEVALRARYRIAGHELERRLGSLVWQPAAGSPASP